VKSSGFFIGLIIFAIIGYAGYYYYNQTYDQTMEEIKGVSTRLPSNFSTPPPASIAAQLATASAEASSSGLSEWKSFVSPRYNYSLNLPKDMNYQSRTDGDYFYYFGPTQDPGGKLTDGISLGIHTGRLNGKSLKQIAGGNAKEVSFGEHKGYQFKEGSTLHIYLPKSAETYLEITEIIAQVDKKDQRFAQIVSEIISSISY
jgi:hypothetical protein